MGNLWRVNALVLHVLLGSAVATWAQDGPQMITVEGIRMRIQAAGIDAIKSGSPVVILEAGALGPETSPLEFWKPIFSSLARLTPVLADEWRGSGLSEADTESPTMRRVAKVLHTLLSEVKIAPPYVLIGHSWGGNYIHAFYDQFASEVVGMVFLDAETGMGPWREEKAAMLRPERRAEALKPPTLPPFPPNTPPGLKMELEQLGKEMISDGAEARTLKRISGIPVGILRATPPGRMRGDSGAITRLIIHRDLDLALSAPNGMLITANHVGHFVQKDDPALTVKLIAHVLEHVAIDSRK